MPLLGGYWIFLSALPETPAGSAWFPHTCDHHLGGVEVALGAGGGLASSSLSPAAGKGPNP